MLRQHLGKFNTTLAKLNNMAEEGGGVSTKGGLQGESSSTLPKSTRFHTQQSTQTLQGDKPGDNAESVSSGPAPEDSDLEDNSHRKGKGKKPEPRPHRRFTLEPGDVEDEIWLTETQDGEEEPQESIFAKVQNAQEFIASAAAHPETWCNAVRNMMTTLIAYREQTYEQQRSALTSKERVASLTQQLKEKNQQLQATSGNEERLRESRNTYRARSTKLKEEVSDLQIEAENLRAQVRALGDPNGDPNSDPDDSDMEGDSRPKRRPPPQRRATAPSSGLPSRRGTPSATATTAGPKSNNKYADVDNFFGNDKDRDDWDAWRMHLGSKFMQSWELFETEVSKILYIRDHCKDVAYNVIKAKANLDAADHYHTAEEMIEELEQQFGSVDKEARADAQLQDPQLLMGAKDPKETFDAFHARFTAIISPLSMTEREKCSNLRRMIASKLKYRILDYPSATSYRELVTRLRQVDLNLRLVDHQNPRGNRGGSSSDTRGGKGENISKSKSNTTDSAQRKNTRYRHPQHVADRLRKEGRCFKCLQPGHLPNETNAPCKDKSWLTEKQVTAMLAETGLEQGANTEPPPTYNQQLTEN